MAEPPSPKPAARRSIPDKTQTQRLLERFPLPLGRWRSRFMGSPIRRASSSRSRMAKPLSRAVSQGSGAILVKALQDAGNRQWFTIVERESLKNLLNERQIIREMRERYLGEQGVNPAGAAGAAVRRGAARRRHRRL